MGFCYNEIEFCGPLKGGEKMKKSAQINSSLLTARQLEVMFIFFFLANCVVIYLANHLFPNNVVLGTYFHSPLMALIYSMVVLTLATTGAVPVIEYLFQVTKAESTEIHWIILSFLLNFVSVWVVARLATFLGMGISSWRVVAILAIILSLSQRVVVKTIIEKI